MTADETLELAHRKAWRYKKSSDSHHSDTYTFNRSTLLEFARKLTLAEREACVSLCDDLDATDSGGYCGDARQCAGLIRARSNAKLEPRAE